MEELTIRAEQMLELIEQMKAINARLEALCTMKCDGCPLSKECLGDAQFDLGMDYDLEKCADYVCGNVSEGAKTKAHQNKRKDSSLFRQTEGNKSATAFFNSRQNHKIWKNEGGYRKHYLKKH